MPYVSKNIFNIVVFSDFCEFKTPRIENVCYLSELIEYINNFKEVKLKEVELLIVIGKLSYMCQTVDITPETHVKNIRQFTKNM